MSKREPKPQLIQPFTRLGHKVKHFGEWIRIATFHLMRLQRVSLLCEGGKNLPIDACCFYRVHSSIFSKSYFTHSLFCLLSLLILCSDCLSHYPCFSYGYCSYLYTKSSLCNFSILPLWLTNHFCLLQTLFRGAHYLFGCMGSTSTTSLL